MNDVLDWLDAAKLSVIVTGAVAVTTVAIQWRRDVGGREHERTMAKDDRDAAFARAQHETRSAVYVDLLTFIARCNTTISRMYPTVGVASDPPPPPWPATDDIYVLDAWIAAFASHEIREMNARWLIERTTFIANVSRLEHVPPDPSAWPDVDRIRRGLFDLGREIKDRVNEELTAAPEPATFS